MYLWLSILFFSIDATEESGRYGRLVNHSRANKNLRVKVEKGPRLFMYALRDIEPGTELLYDYGERSKATLAAHPWLQK